MAKGAYIGVNNVARKIKKGYIGVDGVARKIKKAYIGIGGVARPCWSGGEVVYWGLAPSNLSVGGNLWCGATAGDNAIFVYPNTSTAIYNSSLVKTTAGAVSNSTKFFRSVTFNGNAFFAGGLYSTDSTSNEVKNVSSSGTITSLPNLTQAVSQHAVACVGGYALVAGGAKKTTYNTSIYTNVDAYNTSFTKSRATALTTKRRNHGGGHVGNYALFAGGHNYSDAELSSVETYNSSLTKSKATSLSATGSTNNYINSGNVGDYLIFTDMGVSKAVNCYNSSLTMTVLTPLDSDDYYGGHGFVTLGDFVVCASGETQRAYSYDTSLTRQYITQLSVKRRYCAFARAGNYALYAAGYSGATNYSDIDVYTVV